ncbi:Endo-1,4-beta-xylanase [Pseudoxanthomonas suwonensis 11-1]|uniref:Beta-xylanase n=1 Tax=Pseudoxanthomonas suwonensis (strain 11-1) TaxID=743721 RepID=E6WX38_PSEUU|nr:endo-1,4-beta-xylanase [Pseudoxanthomonas suwonensis]ADV28737.1 Endo-1,4-beta-xylanase [Pseudoxanthomonas suwonensis 11-1]
MIRPRTALLAALALACGSALAAPKTLKDAYRDDFLLGTAVNDAIVTGEDAAQQALAVRHFNAITLENSMKVEVLHPEPGKWDFERADAFVEFGRKHGMFLVGHTLVWHNQTPAWFFEDAGGKPAGTEVMRERLRQYIHTVAGRYAGKVQAWDVVNEQIGEDGQYRDTTWVRAYGGDGDALMRDAFRFAAEAAPGTALYYNDFNAWRPEKVAGIVRMVGMLKASGIRIDGVGIQGHWGLNYPALADIEAAIDAYHAAGVEVMVTELDVDVLPLTKEGQIIGQGMLHPQFQLPEFTRFLDPYRDGLPGEVQQQLAARYAELFALFHRKRDKLSRVSVWGVADDMSWKNGYPIPDRTNYPLLFDRARQPKPALDAVLKVPQGR